jgi:hypothetical protein
MVEACLIRALTSGAAALTGSPGSRVTTPDGSPESPGAKA